MFLIDKGCLHFWIFDTGQKLLIIPELSTTSVFNDLLLAVGDKLGLLINYHLKKADPLEHRKVLAQYLIQKGWNVKPFGSHLYVDEAGHLLVS